MKSAVRRYVTLFQLREAFPGQTMTLAAAMEHPPPRPANLLAEARQPVDIPGHREVVEVSPHHASQPFSDYGNRAVHHASQLRPDHFQRGTHPLLDRHAQDKKPALSGPAATVREAKKVEGFRLSLAPLSPISIRKTTKLDQPRFVWMQDQVKLRQTFPERYQERFRFATPLESKHTVVGITNNDDLPCCVSSPPPIRPQIERIVEVDVRQQRGDDRPLRGAFLGRHMTPVFDHAGLEPLANQSQNPPIRNSVCQKSHHPRMVDGVEERLNIGIQYPAHLVTLDSGRQRVQCMMLTAPGTKSIREPKEIFLIDHTQHLDDGLLHDLVLQRGDSQRPEFAVRFFDINSPRRLRTIGAGVNLPVQFMHSPVEEALVSLHPPQRPQSASGHRSFRPAAMA